MCLSVWKLHIHNFVAKVLVIGVESLSFYSKCSVVTHFCQIFSYGGAGKRIIPDIEVGLRIENQ